MKRLILAGAAAAALFFVSTAAADKSVSPGADSQFPACVANCAYPQKYLAVAPPAPTVAPAPAPLLPPLTCGQIGAYRYCARADGSLILIY